jgi:hypothetical protein
VCAVGDGIAETDDGGGVRGGGDDIDSFDETPGVDGAGVSDSGRSGRVTKGDEGGCLGGSMAGYVAENLLGM